MGKKTGMLHRQLLTTKYTTYTIATANNPKKAKSVYDDHNYDDDIEPANSCSFIEVGNLACTTIT